MKVYTGAGDDGSTGLLYGGRVPKHALAPEAYGAVDEAVASLGVARAEAEPTSEVALLLLRLQRELFVVGAELATAPSKRAKLAPGKTCVDAATCDALADLVHDWEARLPPLTEFVVPGANRLSAALDVARTAVRRAERRAVAMQAAGELDSPLVLQYLNRLSDLVFLLARASEDECETL